MELGLCLDRSHELEDVATRLLATARQPAPPPPPLADKQPPARESDAADQPEAIARQLETHCEAALMSYGNFEIEAFELGRGQWHARCRRADHKPTLIDGVELEFLDIGGSWPSVEAAIADAQKYLDRMEIA